MPRQPRFIHPLNQLRTVLGYSQERFAKMVGISKSQLQKIEIDGHPPSAEMKAKLVLRWGVDPNSIVNKDDTPRSLIGHTTKDLKEALDKWRKDNVIYSNDAPAAFKEHFCPKLEILIEAAARTEKGVIIMQHLNRWISEQVDLLDLSKNVIDILEERVRKTGEHPWVPFITRYLSDEEIADNTTRRDNGQPAE